MPSSFPIPHLRPKSCTAERHMVQGPSQGPLPWTSFTTPPNGHALSSMREQVHRLLKWPISLLERGMQAGALGHDERVAEERAAWLISTPKRRRSARSLNASTWAAPTYAQQQAKGALAQTETWRTSAYARRAFAQTHKRTDAHMRTLAQGRAFKHAKKEESKPACGACPHAQKHIAHAARTCARMRPAQARGHAQVGANTGMNAGLVARSRVPAGTQACRPGLRAPARTQIPYGSRPGLRRRGDDTAERASEPTWCRHQYAETDGGLEQCFL